MTRTFFTFFILCFQICKAQVPYLVKDINPTNALDVFYLNNENITVGNYIYFEANDGIHGNELWKSDGTLIGTTLVKDINIGSNGSFIRNFININNIIYFHVDDGVNGAELWKSDGTFAGTSLVKDINPGAFSSSPSNIINIENFLFFNAFNPIYGNELWKYNSITNESSIVKDICWRFKLRSTIFN